MNVLFFKVFLLSLCCCNDAVMIDYAHLIILLRTKDSGSLLIPCVQMTGSRNMEKWSLFSPLDQRKYMVRISVSGFIVHIPYIVFHPQIYS